MGLGGVTAYLCEVINRDEVVEAYTWAKVRSLPILMIGSGSNIVWRDEGFRGLIIVNNIMGYEVSSLGDVHTLTIGAGENWDSVVSRSVDAGLTGIEALSLIPGTAGATPIQNVGAYGQEISQTLTTVEAFDTQTGQYTVISGSDCQFAYRSSRFKASDRGRFLIVGLTLQLTKANPIAPFYSSVEAYFNEHSVNEYTPARLREAVIAIRQSKLPDPAVVKNNGSFFANPVIPQAKFDEINIDAGIPNWPTSDGKVKVSAAWLIESVGFQDYHDPVTGMATWPQQPLVLINEKARSTADLLSFKQKIVAAVQAKYGISLEQEPEILP